jgi:hypothetical protein
MDPAALGTVRIGLDAIAAEARYDRPRRSTAARKRASRPLRVTIAAGLRRLAAMIDRPTAVEVAR